MAGVTFTQKYFSLSFNCYMLLRDVTNAIKCLLASKKYPEAAFFAKAYCPSEITKVVGLWKENMEKTHPLIGKLECFVF